ncbi:MAG: hypothetical protein LUG99_17680 [Lachnospiraceae bacterium]|nr:hypothetical protein [Lachnospiraceae bacterium]
MRKRRKQDAKCQQKEYLYPCESTEPTAMAARISDWVRIIICMALLVICVAMGFRELRGFQSQDGRWNYVSNGGISLQTAEEILEAATSAETPPRSASAASRASDAENASRFAGADQNLADMIFWTQKSEQVISVTEPVERETEANVILIRGDPRLLVGNYNVPQSGDTSGCLLDKSIALKLFGNTDVIGLSVCYDGREYQILGLLDISESAIIIQMPLGSGEVFTRVTAEKNGDTTSWNLKNTLQNKYQVPLSEIRWGFLRGIVKIPFCLSMMAVYIRLAHFLMRIAKKRWRIDSIYPRFAGAMEFFTGVLLLAFLLKLTGMTQVPAEFIPAKWSDFSFYGEVFDTWKDGMTGFLELPFYALEIQWFQNCLGLSFWTVLGGAASCYAAHCMSVLA